MCEFSDTKRYAWLVKSTTASGVLDKDIFALMKTMFTEGGDEGQILFEQGLSFHLKSPMPNVSSEMESYSMIVWQLIPQCMLLTYSSIFTIVLVIDSHGNYLDFRSEVLKKMC